MASSRLAESMADHLSNDKKLLIEQWVNAYSYVPHTSVEKVKTQNWDGKESALRLQYICI
jgi:hypothetical protein